jgi:hypothetical protein
MDFIHRPWKPEDIRYICERIIGRESVPATHEGNWSRGLQ